MIPIFQTRFGEPLGNCWAACIASILELPIEAVDWSADMTADEILPAGATDVTREWIDRRERNLARLGYWMSLIEHGRGVRPVGVPFRAHYMAIGILPNGIGHVVVCRDGRLVHDPHPGIEPLASIEMLGFLVRL